MDPKLDDLARQLDLCRCEGNKHSLQSVLRSARILSEAKALAQRDYGRWLHEKAHMVRATANCHVRVAEFVERNVQLTEQIAKLSLAKIYALSTLAQEKARMFLEGQDRFSLPLDRLNDVQFRKEFRERFPAPRKKHTREHVFRQVQAAISRLIAILDRERPLLNQLTGAQIQALADQVRDLLRAAAGWKLVG